VSGIKWDNLFYEVPQAPHNKWFTHVSLIIPLGIILYGINYDTLNEPLYNPSHMDHSLGGGLLRVGGNNLVVSRMCEWNEHPETNK